MSKLKLLKIRVGQSLCDFGLWVLSLSHKDHEDVELETRLIDYWRKFESRRKFYEKGGLNE